MFSVVIATRDRAVLFEQALHSVLDQKLQDVEVLVVNDGSRPDEGPLYDAVLERAQQRLGPRLRSFQLPRKVKGHGSSYALNHGVDQAAGRYVCFLDDDDVWTDPGHLDRAAQVIAHQQRAGRVVDVYMTNQHAYRQGQRLPGSTWLEALQAQLQLRGRQPGADGAYAVDIAELLACGGFCHLNCLTVRRAFFLQIGGLDDAIRWENDRDLFLRLLDEAALMVHHPAVTARHHVPDPKAGTSITTGLNTIERRLWQVRVLDKAVLLLRHPLLRQHGQTHKGYALKRIAEDLASRGDWRRASVYAAQALAVLPTLKWALYTASLRVRAWVS